MNIQLRPFAGRALLLVLLALLLPAACQRADEPASTPSSASPTAAAVAAATSTPTPSPGDIVPEGPFDWPPQVVYSEPGSGVEAPLDGPILVRFDQPMDQASVEAAFSFAPAGGTQSVAGDFGWPRPDMLLFTPRGDLARGQQYELAIATTAVGRGGRTLREAVNLKLQTVGFLAVGQTLPADGTDGVQTDAAITVFFNRPVVPLVTTGQQASLPQPLQITPALSGDGQWIATSIYRFVPDGPLDGATRYEVTVAAGLEDMTGGLLAEDFRWSFTTIPPSVVSVDPYDDSTDIRPTKPITITFNMPMDPAATEAAVRVEAFGGEAASLVYSWRDDNRVLILQPEPRLALDTRYAVRVDQAARSAGGQAALDRTTISRFRTLPFPAIRETNPIAGGEAGRWQEGFYLWFASPMVRESFIDAIVIEPKPAKHGQLYYDDNSGFLNVPFTYIPGETYTVTIPAAAADPYGNTLGEDYILSFRAPEPVAIIALNLPHQLSQLSTSRPSEVNVIYRNVSAFTARLYDIGLPARLLLERNVTDYTTRADPLRTWEIAFERQALAADAHALALADGDTLATGVYFLRVEAPEANRDDRWWQNRSNLLVVADVNLVVKEHPAAVHAWVTNLADGQPAAGNRLTFYNHAGQEMGTAVTDGDGLATLARTESDLGGVLVVSNAPGEPGFGVAASSWSDDVAPWHFGLSGAGLEAQRFAYLYTDRPIYRPGDTVHFRGIVRDTDYARFPLPTRQSVTLALEFISDYSYEPVESFAFKATLDETGEFSGQYDIPSDARLGDYRFVFIGDDLDAARPFSVAEYRKPEFLVVVSAEAPEILRGQATQAVVQATYLFGGSAAELPVNWNVAAERYRLPWEGPYYSFDDDAGFHYVDPGPFFFGAPHRQSIVSGSGMTDADGRFVIDLPADMLATRPEGSYRLTAEAWVMDVSNFQIFASTEIVAHAAERYVGLRWEDYAAVAGAEATLELVTVDWAGRPQGGQPVEIVIYEREWRATREEGPGRHYTRYEPIDTERARLSATTDGDGEAAVAFTPPEAGTYIAVATVTDDAGRTQTSTAALWALGGDFFGWRTDARAQRMDLVPDQQGYGPGDTANILVQSPFAGPARAWLTIERGEIIEQRVITLQSSSDVLAIPIVEAFAPNVFVTVVVVKGIDETNAYADMRVGMVELVVDPAHLALDVALTPRESTLRPRDTVTYDVQISDHTGKPVAADLSLALVDLAVLTLKPDNAPPIAEAFFARQPLRSLIGAGLIFSGEGLEIELPFEFPGFGGGNGGAMGAGSYGLDDDDETRRNFPDTAYWAAKVRTDAAGRALVEIPLPDTVTTWRLSSKAVSVYESVGETLVGQDSVDIVATLPLLVRPVTPRFFTVGDALELGAVVHNNTSESLDVVVTLEAFGLTLAGTAEQTVAIPAGGRQLVRWPVTVDDVPFADLTFRAVSGDLRDATKPSFGLPPDQLLPVVRFTGEDIVGTSGVLDAAGRRVEAILLPPNVDARQGEVRVQLSPSLAAALLAALDEVNGREARPACAHDVTDRLLPNVATGRALRELNLPAGEASATRDALISRDIDRLRALQKSAGGWGWCYTAQVDDYLTAYTLLALLKAREAGYEVDREMVDKAVELLGRRIRPAARLVERHQVNRQALFLYVLAEAGQANSDAVEDLVAEHRALLDPYAKAFLALANDLAGGGANAHQMLLADLNDAVVLSAAGAHWQDVVPDWNNLNSDARGTAVVIDALARLDPTNPLAASAVRWLMVARTAETWRTSQDTAWSILALTDWMVASGELNADFGYKLEANGAGVTSGRFAATNIADSDALALPMADLLTDEINFLHFVHEGGPGRLYYSAFLDSYILAEDLDAVSRGVTVQRAYFDASCDPRQTTCQSIGAIEVGQNVRVELTIIAANDLVYAVVQDPIPAGAEALDPGLSTTGREGGGEIVREGATYQHGYWGWWYFNFIEYRDDRVVFYSDFLPAGTYQYTYTLQTSIPGQYQVNPAVANQEFFPDVFGRSEGLLFTILP